MRVSRHKRASAGTCTTRGDRLQAAFPDEFTKTALAIEVERSITGDELLAVELFPSPPEAKVMAEDYR
jgi:hypothetical protein